jgi:hypothetical protein
MYQPKQLHGGHLLGYPPNSIFLGTLSTIRGYQPAGSLSPNPGSAQLPPSASTRQVRLEHILDRRTSADAITSSSDRSHEKCIATLAHERPIDNDRFDNQVVYPDRIRIRYPSDDPNAFPLAPHLDSGSIAFPELNTTHIWLSVSP